VPLTSKSHYENGKFKKFYWYIKSLRSDHTGIPPLHMNGSLYTSSQDKAKILNDYFSSVFTPDRNNDNLPSVDESPYSNIFKVDLRDY